LHGAGLLKYYDVPAPVDVAETSYQDEAYLNISQLKDPSQQAPLIEAFLRDYPQSVHLAGLHRLATLVFLQLRDHKKLVEHGETALRLSPAQPELLRVLAKAYQAAGELDKAIDRASRALSAIKEISKPAGLDESRWRSQLHLFFADNYACLGSVFFEKYETERRKSSASHPETALHLEKAADYLGKAVALDPRSAFAQFHLGIVFAAQNLLDEAMGSLAKAVVLEGALVDIARENLETIYRAIHRDSLDGLDEVIEKARTDLGATKGDISML
jgi:tetratricopeptide (TPR) repeat protein